MLAGNEEGEWRGPRLLIGKWTWGAACGMAVMDVGGKWAWGWADSPVCRLTRLLYLPSLGPEGFHSGLQRHSAADGELPGTQAVSRPSGVDSEYTSERERRIMASERTACAKES